MGAVVQTIEHAGKTIKICLDDDPTSPREWDNLTTIVHWHRRYNFGDRIDMCTSEELEERWCDKGDEILAILPLYLFDHSGISLSVKEFGCPWDSGQVGWAFVTKTSAVTMGIIDLGKENLHAQIRGEIETYDAYLRGEVFGFEIYDADEELLDSCWGFVNDVDDCIANAKELAESYAKHTASTVPAPSTNSDKHYVLVLEGGTELSTSEPFDSVEKRDAEAKRIWNNDCDSSKSDNVFKATVDANGNLSACNYLNGQLDE